MGQVPPLDIRGNILPASREDSDPDRTLIWSALSQKIDFVFQPIVNMHSGATYGVEALARPADSSGYRSITDLLDAAYADASLEVVEGQLITKAIEQFLLLPGRGRIKLFLNLDSRMLGSPLATPEGLNQILGRYRMNASSVCVDICQRHSLDEPDAAMALLRNIGPDGFQIALDDFGVGSTGLHMLYATEPDFIKIDRFYIEGIAESSKKKLFVSHMVNLAHVLGVVAIAEGVETVQELLACKDVGCDLAQGFLIQTPLSADTQVKETYRHIELLSKGERRDIGLDHRLIREQVAALTALPLDTQMIKVFDRFRSDKQHTFFPVIDVMGEPVGIVREADLKDYTYSPYGKELISNKVLGRSLKDFITRCPIADINSKAETILRAYSTDGGGEGLIIVDNLKYVGFLSTQALLRVVNEKNLATARDQNPLTRLPGNNVIHEYVSQALEDRSISTLLVYFDFDNFKPFNDKYGFRIGDRAILLFAELMRSTLPHETSFGGHVGGDDFFAGFKDVAFNRVCEITAGLLESFRHNVESFYDEQALRDGFIEARDRQGQYARFPLLGASAAILCLPKDIRRPSSDEISNLIADLKKPSKESPDHMAAASISGLPHP